MRTTAFESDEREVRGVVKILVHHVLTDLKDTFEREVQRKAMMKLQERMSRVKDSKAFGSLSNENRDDWVDSEIRNRRRSGM
jgi:hypothetical protein